MQNHLNLISAGVSLLFFCSCGADVTGNGGGASGNSSSSAGAGVAGSGVSNGGSASNVSGSPGSSGSGNVSLGGSDATSSGGSAGASSNSAGDTGSGGKPAGTAGSPTSAGGAAGGSATGSCSRASLTAAVDAYQAAQTAGDKSKMPLSPAATFTENFKATTLGIWQTPLVVAYRHDLLDTVACQTFSEVYVTEGSQQYVLGIRLAVKDGQITELESIVTTGTVSGGKITSTDWNFDAKAYLTCAKSEDWSVVPEAHRNTREQLIAAGEAYFKIFSDKATVVPWGTPCFRLEGGLGCTPAMDMGSQSCNVGVPSGITFKDTHWVVDLELNTAVGLTLFAGKDPDSHTFRLIDGKIVKVHTLTQGTG